MTALIAALPVILGGRRYLGDSDDVHRGWIGLKLAGVLLNTGRSGIDVPGDDGAAAPRLEQRGRLGLALEGHHGWHYRLGHVLSWLATADLDKSRPGDDWSDETLVRAGAELTLYGLVSGRVGRIDRGDDSPYTGLAYGVGLRIAPLGRPIGVRGDWASMPYDPEGAVASLPYAKQRLDRFSVAVWLDL